MLCLLFYRFVVLITQKTKCSYESIFSANRTYKEKLTAKLRLSFVYLHRIQARNYLLLYFGKNRSSIYALIQIGPHQCSAVIINYILSNTKIHDTLSET